MSDTWMRNHALEEIQKRKEEHLSDVEQRFLMEITTQLNDMAKRTITPLSTNTIYHLERDVFYEISDYEFSLFAHRLGFQINPTVSEVQISILRNEEKKETPALQLLSRTNAALKQYIEEQMNLAQDFCSNTSAHSLRTKLYENFLFSQVSGKAYSIAVYGMELPPSPISSVFKDKVKQIIKEEWGFDDVFIDKEHHCIVLLLNE